jgi:hypothetical protein
VAAAEAPVTISVFMWCPLVNATEDQTRRSAGSNVEEVSNNCGGVVILILLLILILILLWCHRSEGAVSSEPWAEIKIKIKIRRLGLGRGTKVSARETFDSLWRDDAHC